MLALNKLAAARRGPASKLEPATAGHASELSESEEQDTQYHECEAEGQQPVHQSDTYLPVVAALLHVAGQPQGVKHNADIDELAEQAENCWVAHQAP